MVLAMEGFYHIHELIVPQCVKINYYITLHSRPLEDQVINSYTYSRRK